MSARALRACGRSFGDAARSRLVPVKTVRPIWAGVVIGVTLRDAGTERIGDDVKEAMRGFHQIVERVGVIPAAGRLGPRLR